MNTDESGLRALERADLDANATSRPSALRLALVLNAAAASSPGMLLLMRLV
jgi:hypothetical protein